MAAVVNELRIKIKSDLMEKMITTVAFKTFDECWEEAKRQLKVIFIQNNFFNYYNYLIFLVY